jgi:hypothetical protein
MRKQLLLFVALQVGAYAQALSTPANSVGQVPIPARASSRPSQPTSTLTEPMVVDPSQVKEVATRVGLLESERTWVIGLGAGLGIGIGLVVWLRKDIIRTLVQEAFPDKLPEGTDAARWYPNRAQWRVIWVATTVLSVVFIWLPFRFDLSLRLLIALFANAVLFVIWFSERRRSSSS